MPASLTNGVSFGTPPARRTRLIKPRRGAECRCRGSRGAGWRSLQSRPHETPSRRLRSLRCLRAAMAWSSAGSEVDPHAAVDLDLVQPLLFTKTQRMSRNLLVIVLLTAGSPALAQTMAVSKPEVLPFEREMALALSA